MTSNLHLIGRTCTLSSPPTEFLQTHFSGKLAIVALIETPQGLLVHLINTKGKISPSMSIATLENVEGFVQPV